MTLTEPKWYQYVAIHLCGKGKVHWTQTEYTGPANYRRRHVQVSLCSASETYVDLMVVVWGDKAAPQPTKIDPGTVSFPFQLTIPEDCPPTFKTNIGKIQYKLFGIVSNQVSEFKIKTPLIINPMIDLNQQPHLLQPIYRFTIKNVIIYCGCNAGEVQLTLKMPRSGFCVARECIPVTFECKNGSSRQITARIEVAQYIVYKIRDTNRIKSITDKVGDFSCQIQPLELDMKSVEFDLPSSIVLKFATDMITVSHSMRIWVTHSFGGDFGRVPPPLISIPVVIGNVPFHGTVQTPLPPSSIQPSVSAPPLTSLQQQPGYPPQGPGAPPVAMPQPSVVETPPNAELQSQAPPSYWAVISGEKF